MGLPVVGARCQRQLGMWIERYLYRELRAVSATAWRFDAGLRHGATQRSCDISSSVENGDKAVPIGSGHGGRVDGRLFLRVTVVSWSAGLLAGIVAGQEAHCYDRSDRSLRAVSWEAIAMWQSTEKNGNWTAHQGILYFRRASNEAAFLFTLCWYGHQQNFTDCSNMCHEASGVALDAGTARNRQGHRHAEDFSLADG